MAGVRGIVVEVIGDDRSALRMWERQIASTSTVDKAYKKVALTAQETAAAQVSASVKAMRAQEAQVASLRAIAATSPAGSRQQIAATALAADAQARLARSQGLTVASTRRLSAATKEGERDLGKVVRGGLAGAGVFHSLGRSLAFASGGFLAFAIGASAVARSITAARNLAIAQRQVNQQLRVSGKAWKNYSDQIEPATTRLVHLAGFTHVELLRSFGFMVRATGNVGNSLRLMGIAADVARGRGISLQAASLALTKAVGGSATALRRLGIIVPATAKGWDAINFVAQKFRGQAAAGTSAVDRFNATLNLTAEITGATLLPIVNRYLVSLGNWLSKMNESGRLQQDVKTIVGGTVDVFRDLGKVIGAADKITGSFGNTLKVLIGLKFASLAAGWIASLATMARSWGAVKVAAIEAGAAESAALGAGAAGGAAGAGAIGVAEGAAAGGVLFPSLFRNARASRASAKAIQQGINGVGKEASIASAKVGALQAGLLGLASNPAIVIPIAVLISQQPQVKERQNQLKRDLGPLGFLATNLVDVVKSGLGKARDLNTMMDQLLGKATGVNPPEFPASLRRPTPTLAPAFFPQFPTKAAVAAAAPGPFGTAKPMTQFFKQFQLNFGEQLDQVQASLTRSTKDDVAAAKQVVARIKSMLDQGRLHGKALIDALGLEASALSTIWSAEDAAAQKRAQAAQAAKERAAAAFSNLVDPLRLEVALLRAEASGGSTLRVLREMLATARKALASAKGLKQQQEALQQIVSVQQQIKDASQNQTIQFQVPARLALRLARDQALGRDTTKDLLAIKKAILRFIAHHKKNIKALTDAYNQLADINQQLGQNVKSFLGGFHQASTRALTAGLGLTPEQRRALRARLSQLGPGGTVPGTGVGAAGFIINPDTGRPIQVHTQINVDGKRVADNTTRHQQRHRRRNPKQRRGPNAATG